MDEGGSGSLRDSPSRISPHGIFSGVVVAVGALGLCMGFSWALGLSAFRPGAAHLRGMALAATWAGIAIWASVFLGAFVAASVARAADTRDGVLHGLVVWGAMSALLGILLLGSFAGMFNTLTQLSGAKLAGGESAKEVAGTARTFLGNLALAATVTSWLYWAGIAGALFTGAVGGYLGARSEQRVPLERRGEERERGRPSLPTQPQPT